MKVFWGHADFHYPRGREGGIKSFHNSSCLGSKVRIWDLMKAVYLNHDSPSLKSESGSTNYDLQFV